MNNFMNRFYSSFKSSLNPSLKTIIWLLKLMIPVSFAVLILDWSGALRWISHFTSPIAEMIGLRGEAALALLTGAILNIYSAIAVIESVPFTMREITIMALMILIAHNLVIEVAVQKKTGSSGIWMLILRLSVSFICGFVLNLVLPNDEVSSRNILIKSSLLTPSIFEILLNWTISTLYLIFKVILFVGVLNFLHKLLEEFKIMEKMSNFFAPLLMVFGLPKDGAFMWIVANVVGLAWGSAILIEHIKQGKLSRKEADMINHHIALSHSLLEDTLLFVAIGVSFGWIVFPRLIVAFITVWIYRLVLYAKEYNVKSIDILKK